MSAQQHKRLRIVIVAPVTVPYDAISTAGRDTFRMLFGHPAFDVAFIAHTNHFADFHPRIADGIIGLLYDSAFCAADLIIYHFGIYHPFFDALLVGNGRARQVVVFHNITPPEFVDPAGRGLIDRSFAQLHNLAHADVIWADSQVNADVLTQREMDGQRIEVIPLCVERPDIGSLAAKPSATIEALFVGRAVKSKGLMDCIEATAAAVRGAGTPLRLTIAGNSLFSDAGYLARCEAAVAELGLKSAVSFCGTVDDAGLAEAYRRAHFLMIPSYHEGFCMPVVEGLRAGCMPIGYAAGNVPQIAGGLGCLVPAGDMKALSAALLGAAQSLGRALRAPELAALPLDRGLTSVAEFDRAAKEHVDAFGFARVRAIRLASIEQLLAGKPPPPRQARDAQRQEAVDFAGTPRKT